jgi:hypothetical protein
VPPAKDDSGAIGRLRADWIGRVVRDPKEPAEAMALTGFLAASPRDDHHRLYLDLNLSSYVDIPAADVLHGQRMQEDSALGEVIVWVRRDARLGYGPAGAQAGSFFEGSIANQFGGAGGFPGGGFPGGGGVPPYTIPPFCPLPTLPPGCFPPTSPLRGCPPPTFPWTGCPPPTLPWTGCPPPTLPPRCPPRTPVIPCLHTVIDCPVRTPVIPCRTTDPICYPVRTPVVPCIQITQLCPVNSAVVICQTNVCPSAVDACPSAPGGCDTPITPQTPQTPINPGGYFGGGLGSAYGYGG